MKKLNKEIEDKAKRLNQWILNQEFVKEYQKYEQLIKNNSSLHQLEEELKDLQQKIVMSKHQNIDCEIIMKEYQQKRKSFDENPLVHNYLVLKQEVNDLLILIQDNINQELSKKD
ncbi:YlbF family regulator [Longibaculum muris]|uniref:YlbF family regulator n=1 Tax=Longibaculum muris TaxID=1796628 RepID=UPI0012B7DFB4|nr:YlbF family regulator [Longibaculum muris]